MQKVFIPIPLYSHGMLSVWWKYLQIPCIKFVLHLRVTYNLVFFAHGQYMEAHMLGCYRGLTDISEESVPNVGVPPHD